VVAETTVKRFCCGFQRTGKAMGHYINVISMSRKNNVFFRFEYRAFYVLYPFLTNLLTFLRMQKKFNLINLINYTPRHEDVRESGYIVPPFLNSATDGGEW
jgi:hypothetical protein